MRRPAGTPMHSRLQVQRVDALVPLPLGGVGARPPQLPGRHCIHGARAEKGLGKKKTRERQGAGAKGAREPSISGQQLDLPRRPRQHVDALALRSQAPQSDQVARL